MVAGPASELPDGKILRPLPDLRKSGGAFQQPALFTSLLGDSGAFSTLRTTAVCGRKVTEDSELCV